MFGIVNLNITVDKIYVINNFIAGNVYRPQETLICAGGKGVNTARALSILKMKSQVFAFLGGRDGEFIKKELQKDKISVFPVNIKENTRSCTIIVDIKNQNQTVVNEIGPIISIQEFKIMQEKFNEFIIDKNMLIISGTTPPGMPKNAYCRMISLAKKFSIPVVLDTSGENLKESLKEKGIFLIKPNLNELEEFINRKISSDKQIIDAAIEMKRKYCIENILVSLGKKGAILVGRNNIVLKTASPKIKIINAVSCGDVFLAGFIYGWTKTKNLKQALETAVACGSAKTQTLKSGYFKRRKVC